MSNWRRTVKAVTTNQSYVGTDWLKPRFRYPQLRVRSCGTPGACLRILLRLLCALCAALAPVPVAAQDRIEVRVSTHAYAFGSQVRFHLEAVSAAPIQSVVLAYRTSDTQGTTIETLSVGSATEVNVEHVHEISRRYIRPFVEVTYWWTIIDVEGDRLTTPEQSFSYADNRFNWETLSQDAVNVHWYRGDVQIAQQSLDVAVAAMARARQDIQLEAIQKPIDVYLYANAEDLRLALPAGLPSGADALTLYETNVILVPYGPEAANIPGLRRILPHEVTHALIHEATQTDFDDVPMWLAEGMATSVEYEFAPDPDAQLLLEQAMDKRSLLDLNTLCAEFPSDWATARLAYVQSASVVDHIRNLYGRQALRDLVAAYADGATCDGGIQRVFGFSLDRLELSWHEYMAPRSTWAAFWESNGAWVILVVLFAGLPLLFLRPSRPRARGARGEMP
jgi:hypothetical protein